MRSRGTPGTTSWTGGRATTRSRAGGGGCAHPSIRDVAADGGTEAAGGGYDIVQIGVSDTLDAEVEELVLLGTGNINGTGNALDNVITGTSGNNSLSGGLGADTLIGGAGNGAQAVGNGLANVLTGNASANVLDGEAGADTMAGGAGSDVYYVDDAGDVVQETVADSVSGGNGTVMASLSYSIAANANLNNVTLTGTDNVDATGNGVANVLVGNLGHNELAGGAGNDTYYIDRSDFVWEASGAGTDTVFLDVGISNAKKEVKSGPLPGSIFTAEVELWNVEKVTLLGVGDFGIKGSSAANTFVGNIGSNRPAGRDRQRHARGRGG